ncbi:MAG: NifU family protein [Peptostreptococcales bacterium]
MEEKIKAVIDEIRPFLQRDGGDVQFVDYTEGIVKVMLQGACNGCPGAQMTLKTVIEKILKEKFPEVKEVVGI